MPLTFCTADGQTQSTPLPNPACPLQNATCNALLQGASGGSFSLWNLQPLRNVQRFPHGILAHPGR